MAEKAERLICQKLKGGRGGERESDIHNYTSCHNGGRGKGTLDAAAADTLTYVYSILCSMYGSNSYITKCVHVHVHTV